MPILFIRVDKAMQQHLVSQLNRRLKISVVNCLVKNQRTQPPKLRSLSLPPSKKDRMNE